MRLSSSAQSENNKGYDDPLVVNLNFALVALKTIASVSGDTLVRSMTPVCFSTVMSID